MFYGLLSILPKCYKRRHYQVIWKISARFSCVWLHTGWSFFIKTRNFTIQTFYSSFYIDAVTFFVILWHLVKYKCDIYPTKALLSKMQSPNLSPLCTMQRIIDDAIFCEYYRINYPRDETNWAKDLSLLHIMTSMCAQFSRWVYMHACMYLKCI